MPRTRELWTVTAYSRSASDNGLFEGQQVTITFDKHPEYGSVVYTSRVQRYVPDAIPAFLSKVVALHGLDVDTQEIKDGVGNVVATYSFLVNGHGEYVATVAEIEGEK